jgi:hypothetical protein
MSWFSISSFCWSNFITFYQQTYVVNIATTVAYLAPKLNNKQNYRFIWYACNKTVR